MNHRIFFRISLLFPVLVFSLLELGRMLYGREFTNSLPTSVASLWLDARIGIQMGWIQYLALCAFLAWGFGRWSFGQSLLNGTLAPIYYGIVVLVTLFIYGNILGDPTAEYVGIFMAVMSITYGYVYVAVVLAGFYVLKRLGAISA